MVLEDLEKINEGFKDVFIHLETAYHELFKIFENCECPGILFASTAHEMKTANIAYVLEGAIDEFINHFDMYYRFFSEPLDGLQIELDRLLATLRAIRSSRQVYYDYHNFWEKIEKLESHILKLKNIVKKTSLEIKEISLKKETD